MNSYDPPRLIVICAALLFASPGCKQTGHHKPSPAQIRAAEILSFSAAQHARLAQACSEFMRSRYHIHCNSMEKWGPAVIDAGDTNIPSIIRSLNPCRIEIVARHKWEPPMFCIGLVEASDANFCFLMWSAEWEDEDGWPWNNPSNAPSRGYLALLSKGMETNLWAGVLDE